MSSRMIGKAGWMIDELKGCMQRLTAGPGWALGRESLREGDCQAPYRVLIAAIYPLRALAADSRAASEPPGLVLAGLQVSLKKKSSDESDRTGL